MRDFSRGDSRNRELANSKANVGSGAAVESATGLEAFVKRSLREESWDARERVGIGNRNGIGDRIPAGNEGVPNGAIGELLLMNAESAGLRSLEDVVRNQIHYEIVGGASLIGSRRGIDDGIVERLHSGHLRHRRN